jgi:DNA-binding IclR family transcriptional regulator
MHKPDKSKRDHTIQSVSVAARILRVIGANAGPAALRDIAAAADASTSLTHRYLKSLIKEELVQQDRVSGYYDLGPATLALGLSALRRVDVIEVAARELKLLTITHGISGGIAIWTNRGPTMVRWYRGPLFAISTVSLGDILPLDGSATGLVFQAYLPEEVVERGRQEHPVNLQLKNAKPPRKEELESIRARGGSILTGHIQSGVAGQAAPIFNAQNDLACVMTTVSSSDSADELSTWKALKALAEKVSAELGATEFS